MKLNYYAYHIENKHTGKKFQQRIDLFLKAFTLYQNTDFKNGLIIKGRNYYLLNPTGSLFLFLQTDSADLIKRINKQNITADDINNLLSEDEHIAFASYIYFDKFCFGIASPSSSPKITSFCNFINKLLINTGNMDYHIVARPLLIEEIDKTQALKLDFMGQATIEVGTENNFAQHILGFLGMKMLHDYIDLGSIQVVFKPQRRRNIKPIIARAISEIEPDNLQKFIIAAKDVAQEGLTQYYIEGSGIIHDVIPLQENNKLAESICAKMANNIQLIKRLEVENNEEITNQEVIGISRFSQPDTWSNFFNRL